jgi:hypothetical protein
MESYPSSSVSCSWRSWGRIWDWRCMTLIHVPQSRRKTLWSFGLKHRVTWEVGTTGSEEHEVSIFRIKHWKLRQCVPSKRWYPATRLHDVIVQKT